MKIVICQHQQSVSKCDKIIQGPTYLGPGLTPFGVSQAKKLANHRCLLGVQKIITSPAVRALETALIINSKLTVPLQVENLLQELDYMPEVESGDEAYARVLCFLEKYRWQQPADLVVTHTSFMYYLRNTCMNIFRIMPVNISYNSVYEVLGNPWEKIQYSRILTAKTAEVLLVPIDNKFYVMKCTQNDSALNQGFQTEISKAVNLKQKDLVPYILCWDCKGNTTVQVSNYFPGHHIYTSLSECQAKNLIVRAHNLSVILTKINTEYRPSLEEKLHGITNHLDGCDWSRYLCNEFLGNTAVYDLLKKKDALSHYDLHRSNILFVGDTASFVDMGAFVYSHPAFMPASLFTASFMLEGVNRYSLSWFLSKWPSKLDKEKIIVFIKTRLLIGLSFFERKRIYEGLDADDNRIMNKYIVALNSLFEVT